MSSLTTVLYSNSTDASLYLIVILSEFRENWSGSGSSKISTLDQPPSDATDKPVAKARKNVSKKVADSSSLLPILSCNEIFPSRSSGYTPISSSIFQLIVMTTSEL